MTLSPRMPTKEETQAVMLEVRQAVIDICKKHGMGMQMFEDAVKEDYQEGRVIGNVSMRLVMNIRNA